MPDTYAAGGYLRLMSSHLAEAQALLDQAHTVDMKDGYHLYLVARAQVYATMAVAAAQAAEASK